MTASKSGFMGHVKGRRWIAWTCLGLALLVLLASSLTVWVKQQALDTDNWVDTSSQLLQDDEVRQVVAADMVDGLFSSSDVEARLQQALPPRLDPLAAPATGLLRQAALDAANRLLERPAVQTLWEEANRRAHERLVGLLEGDTDRALQAENGDVVLDLQPLIQALGDRLGIEVNPKNPEAGRITIMHSDQLQSAQDAVKAIKTLSVFAVIAVIVLLVLAVYLGEGFRREVLCATAVGLIGIGILLLVVRRVVGNAVVDSLTSSSTREAGSAVWLIGTGLLRDIALGLVLYGIVLLVGVLLAGPTRWAIAGRRKVAPFVRAHPPVVHVVVGAVFLLLLLWGPNSGGRRLLAVLILAALAMAGAEVLRRQIVRESPPGTA